MIEIKISDKFAPCKWCKYGHPRDGKPIKCTLHTPPTETIPENCIDRRTVHLN